MLPKVYTILKVIDLLVDNVSLSKLQTNGHPIRTLEDKLTSKGKDLIAFIIRNCISKTIRDFTKELKV